ncbi:type IV pilus assembly PilZ [Anaeromyxobacter dehalogenans 2CP-1]|uniref:Type IV pilus assembly PilZ n=1 Tax=Anaeromyxobacter dehalogenans (strain ATCC BAA-258 / DSM 21875 / 2CP-1) TaxID=455488 RepID=B8JBR9_ANAD2|nr:PilZ domain-containing protein [Anaeromyxobacter dehalogenans]ACL67677.1 type IV pilus assembly PilZ [Anaeromyxobacter dehalogenans 2CP-1]
MNLDAVIHNPRATPRVPARCEVRVRQRLWRWSAETADLGPGGCQLVSGRPVPPGRSLRVTLAFPALRCEVRTAARVVWSRPSAPGRLGLVFEGAPSHRAWFQALAIADPAVSAAARRTPDRLPLEARVFLGDPPPAMGFTPDELALLRRVGSGVAVRGLLASLGGTPSERIVGALFGLVTRGLLVLEAAASPGPERWRAALAAAEAAAGVPALARPSAAQRLYEEGMEHLAAGRTALALRRFEEARAHAPADREIAAMAARLARWR